MRAIWTVAVAILPALTVSIASAQINVSDYERALGLRDRYRARVQHLPDAPQWIADTHRFVYRRTVGEGHEFVLVDADAGTTRPAFDHARLATALSQQMKTVIEAGSLPFEKARFDAAVDALDFDKGDDTWHCNLQSYVCSKESHPAPPHDEEDEGYDGTPARKNGASFRLQSPDGRWEAGIENFNVVVRVVSSKAGDSEAPAIVLSTDGSEGNYYAFDTLAWSPDSKHLAAYRIRPGYKREVHYVESSPADQLQPRYSAMIYPKPGDVLALYQPVLFQVDSRQQIDIENTLFPNAYEMTPFVWWKDSRGVTFEYNQRGHQLYRMIEVNAASGAARTVVEESSRTMVNYPPLSRNQYDHGQYFRKDMDDGKRILWASERDGWEHLYLFDGSSGAVIRQVTRGPWVVRAVDRVDEKTQTVYFEASGMNPEEDPYYVHGYSIHLDRTGLTPLSPAHADHSLSYSSDGKFFVDTYSRIDLAPVMELHRTQDGSLAMQVDAADDKPLRAEGWNPPEPFHALGRDGKTAIWGVIYRPAHFDAGKKYPVIEDIYAGPQGSFVPKSFSARAEPLTELGFVVVQIDGMGTNNRSRAFHDVAWRNLKDAGFEDRILWHRAVARQYPWYDISRVGIFGTSAGGQNALAALLFHPEFYRAGVANCGSHDNRMDKIWWNEQWMGWPVGPWYSESSNVDNAWRLKGKLLLIVGEMDKNVDPSTTMQVADRLIKAGKDFELLVVPGGGHGSGGAFGDRKVMDFFVRNLLHEPTPDWNAQPEEALKKWASSQRR